MMNKRKGFSLIFLKMILFPKIQQFLLYLAMAVLIFFQ